MNNLLFIGGFGMQEILVVLLIVLIFFGGKKIPELMRGFGQGVKAFKDGMNETSPNPSQEGENSHDKDSKTEETK